MGSRRHRFPTFASTARALAVALAATVALAGCDWTALGFGPANTSYNPFEPGLTETSVRRLDVTWSAPCACVDRALVADGVVYVVTGYTGSQPYALSLRAFDAATGVPRWSKALGTVQSARPGAIANGLVYVVVNPTSGSPRLVAFDAATGVRRWRFIPSFPGGSYTFLTNPVIVDGPRAFVAAIGGLRSDVFAVDTAGDVEWSAAPGGFISAITADPVRHTVYVSSQLFLTTGAIQLLTGYAGANGSVRSAVSLPFPPINAFVSVESLGFASGLVIGTQPNFHGEGGTGAFAVHPDTGDIAWTGNGGAVSAITPSVVIEFNFRAPLDTVARDTQTGAVKWERNTSAGLSSPAAGDFLYGGGVHVLRLSDGSEVTAVPDAPFGAITPSGGRVFVAGEQLVALEPR